MSEEKRKCKVIYEGISVDGDFEEYADIQATDESGHTYTHRMAIIEKTDGKVITVSPAAVTFIKK